MLVQAVIDCHIKDFSAIHGMMLAAQFGISYIVKWYNITLKITK